ncbi:MAG: amidase, partial [Actinobacteria bacterium]|nr:amidase [Actinomycetota bacterium]
MNSYVDLDATAVAAAVHSGEASIAEIRDAATEQYLKTHGDINAVVEWYKNPTPVASPDGPLAGVPVLRKDYGSTEAGRLTEM